MNRKPKNTTPAAFDAAASLSSLGVDDQVAKDWIAHRRSLKTSVTQTVIDAIVKEAGKAGISMTAALSESCARGWRGFKAEWMEKAAGFKTQKQINDEATNRALFGYRMNEQAEKVITGETL